MNIAERIRSILPGPKYVEGADILIDGGLENWLSESNLTSWTEDLSGSGTVSREGTEKRSGTYSAKLSLTSPGYSGFYQNLPRIVPGKRYRMSLWYKGTVGADLFIAFAENSWAHYIVSANRACTGSWQLFTVDFDGLEGYSDYVFYLNNSNTNNSDIYVDDMSLKPLTPAGIVSCWLPGSVITDAGGSRAGRAIDIISGNHGQAYGLVIPEVPAHGYCKEMLTDGGLENWATATDLTNWAEVLDGTSTANREATVRRSGGSYSCRMDISASNNRAYITQNVTVVPGNKYRLSFWYKTDVGKTCRSFVPTSYLGTTYYLQADGSWKKLGDSGFSYFFAEYLTSPTWARISIDFSAPGYDATGFSVNLDSEFAASSSIYFDDISLLEFQETLGPELLADGRIETWASSSDATFWTELINGGANVIAREAVQKHGGTYSVKFTHVGTGSASLAQYSTLRSGKRYRTSVWLMGDGTTNSQASYSFSIGGSWYYLQSNGSWKLEGDPGFNYFWAVYNTASWKKFSVDFVIPSGAGELGMAVGTWGPAGVCYADDISLREILSPPIQTDLGWTFSGFESYIEVPSSTSLNVGTNDVTLLAWIRTSAAIAKPLRIISKRAVSGIGYEMYIEGTSNLGSGYIKGFGDSIYGSLAGTNNIRDGVWHMVTAVFIKGGPGEFYRDGVLDGSRDLTTSLNSVNHSGPLQIGCLPGYAQTQAFEGSIALPTVFNKALSAQEIANIYRETKGFFYPRG